MDLQTLHAEHKALQLQAADVGARMTEAEQQHKADVDAIFEQWRKANIELIQEFEQVTVAAETKEKELRTAMIEAYTADPSKKKLGDGLSVRVTVKPVYDREKAFAWAKEHGLALALDAKAFEKIASVQTLDFVNTEETIVAVIGK